MACQAQGGVYGSHRQPEEGGEDAWSRRCDRRHDGCKCGAARMHAAWTRARLSVLFLFWCSCVPGASQVPEECGTPHSGTLGSEEACQGFYVGADAGFTTQCGDGIVRAGGCEVGVTFAFEHNDADGDGAIDATEGIVFLAALGIDAEKKGAIFELVDGDFDGKMTIQEWKHAGNIHPKLGMRVTAASGFDKIIPMESADFGPHFREELGTTYSFPLAVGNPIEGCTPLQGDGYGDRIVLMKRGTCEFCMKAKSAQAAGAKAVMIANNDDSLIHMTVGTCGEVNIPSIMIPHSVLAELETLSQNEEAHVYFPTCLEGGTIMPGYGLESCDDGNTVDGDGCNSKCIRECGNNLLNGEETCDDGNLNDGDGCSSTCSLEEGFVECTKMGCSSQCGDRITVGELEGCDSAVSFAFARADMDGDGELTLEESKTVFEAVVIPEEQVSDKFGQCDRDSNGKISVEEWEHFPNIHPPLALRIITFSGTMEIHEVESADFGEDFRHNPGTVFIGIIQVADPIEGCSELTGHYHDRIVLMKRGTCEFCMKAKAAQAAGAKAVMVANKDETVIHMTIGTCGQDVSIPSIMVPHSVGEEFQHERYKAASVIFPICPSGSPMKPGYGMEECDDGNTDSGDGCSSQCICEGECPIFTTSTTTTPGPTTTSSTTTPSPTTSSSTTPTPTTSSSTTPTPTTSSSTTPTPTTSSGTTPNPTTTSSTTTPVPTTSSSTTKSVSTTALPHTTTTLHEQAPTTIVVTDWTSTTPTPSGADETHETTSAEGTHKTISALGTTLIITSPSPTAISHSIATPVSVATTPAPCIAGTCVSLAVSLPISLQNFTPEKQTSFRQAILKATQVAVSVYMRFEALPTLGRRRLLVDNIKISVEVIAADNANAQVIEKRLTAENINEELAQVGLPDAVVIKRAMVIGAISNTSTTLLLQTTPIKNLLPSIGERLLLWLSENIVLAVFFVFFLLFFCIVCVMCCCMYYRYNRPALCLSSPLPRSIDASPASQSAGAKKKVLFVQVESTSENQENSELSVHPPAHVALKLLLDYRVAGEEGSDRRKVFEEALLKDLTRATSMPAHAFEITKISPGSITVNLDIHPHIHSHKMSCDVDVQVGASLPSNIAESLQLQAAKHDSLLRKGRLTRHVGSVHICLKGEYAKTGNDAQKMIHANTEDDTLKDDTLTEQLAMQLAMQHQVAMALKKRLVEESLAKKNTGQATARAERQADEAVWSKTNGEQEAAKKIMKEAVKWRVSPDKDREAYVNQCLECLLEEHALAVEANVQGRARSPVSNIRVTQNMLKEVVEDLIMELAEEMVVVEVMEVMMEEVVEEEEVVKESGDRLQEEVGCGMVQVADVGEEEMKGLVIEVIKKMNVMEFMMNFVVDVVEELGQDKDSVSGCVCVDSVFETGSPEDVAKHVGQLMKSVVCGTGENLMDGLVEEIVMDCVGSEVGENLMLELAEEMVVIEVMEVMIEAEDEEVQEFARSIGEIKQPKSPVRMCGLRLDTKSLEILQGDSSREKRRETEDRALKSREHQTRLFGQSQQTQNPLRMSESQHDTQSLEKSHADTRGEAKEKTSEIATESAVRMGFLPEVSQSKSVSRASQNLENSLAPKLTFSQRSSGPAKRAAPNQLRNNDVNTSPVVLRKTETSIPEANKRRDLVPPKARLDRVPDHPSQQLQPTNSLKQAALATSLSPLLALVISSSQNDTASRITEAGPSLHRAKVVSPQTPRSFHRAPLAEPEQTLSPLQPMSPAYAKPNISGLSTGRALPSSNLGAETQAETQGAKVPKVRSSPPAQPSKPSSPSVDRIAREEENRGLVKKAVKKAVKEMGEDLMIELAVEVVKMVYQEALQQVRDDNGFQLSKQSRDRGRDRYGDRSRKSTPQSAKRDARVDALLQLQWSQEDRLEQDRLLPTKSGHRLFETISRDQDSVSHGDKYRGQPVTMPRAEARLNGAADTMRKHSPVMADRSPRDSRDASQDGERTFSASPPMQYGPAAALTIEPMSPGEPTVTLGWGSLSPPRLGSRQEAPRDLAGYAGVSNQKRQGGKEKEAVLEVTLLPTTPRNPRRSPRVSASAADRDKDRHRERDRDQEAVASASTPRAEAALRGEAQKTSTHKKASSPRAQDCQSKLLLSLETKSAGAPNPSSFPMLK